MQGPESYPCKVTVCFICSQEFRLEDVFLGEGEGCVCLGFLLNYKCLLAMDLQQHQSLLMP